MKNEMIDVLRDGDEEYRVGDAVITADGDTGRIVELYPASSGWDDHGDRSGLWDADEFMAGAVIDLGPSVGRFRFDKAYFGHFVGALPTNSQGFMALLIGDRELTGEIQ
jgi:hypothetical protein